MQFFGAFTLLVLPLFLLVCIRMIQQSDFGTSLFGKLLVFCFYIAIFSALGVALWLLSNI